MKKNMIVFIGKDGSRWPFQQLTGLPHPNTNSVRKLRKYAQAALRVDHALARYAIVKV